MCCLGRKMCSLRSLLLSWYPAPEWAPHGGLTTWAPRMGEVQSSRAGSTMGACQMTGRSVWHPECCLAQKEGRRRKPPAHDTPDAKQGSEISLVSFPLFFHWPQGTPISTRTAKLLTSHQPARSLEGLCSQCSCPPRAAALPRVRPHHSGSVWSHLAKPLALEATPWSCEEHRPEGQGPCVNFHKAKSPQPPLLTRLRLTRSHGSWTPRWDPDPTPSSPTGWRRARLSWLRGENSSWCGMESRVSAASRWESGHRCLIHGSAQAPPAEPEPASSSKALPWWARLRSRAGLCDGHCPARLVSHCPLRNK